VTHHRGSGQAQRVEQIVHQLQRVVAHAATPVSHRPGQAMARQLHKKSPVTGKIGEPGCPHGGGQAHTVQHHQGRACPDAEHPQAHLRRAEIDKRLLGLQATAHEQPGLGLPDPLIEVHCLIPLVARLAPGRPE